MVGVPRDQNILADSLTNSIFGGFTESKRIKVEFGDLKWIVLDELMAKAGDLDSEAKLAKTSKEVKGFIEKDAKLREAKQNGKIRGKCRPPRGGKSNSRLQWGQAPVAHLTRCHVSFGKDSAQPRKVSCTEKRNEVS